MGSGPRSWVWLDADVDDAINDTLCVCFTSAERVERYLAGGIRSGAENNPFRSENYTSPAVVSSSWDGPKLSEPTHKLVERETTALIFGPFVCYLS